MGTQRAYFAALAQLDRVFGYEPKGRGFESLTPCQKKKVDAKAFTFFFCRDIMRDSKQWKNNLNGCFWTVTEDFCKAYTIKPCFLLCKNQERHPPSSATFGTKFNDLVPFFFGFWCFWTFSLHFCIFALPKTCKENARKVQESGKS